MINGTLENTPTRKIVGKAELLGGSATLKYCRIAGWVDEIYPVPHDIKISAKSENLLDLNGITTNGDNGYGIPRVEGNNLVITPRADGVYYAICPHTDLYSQLEEGETYTFSMDSVSGHGSNWGWRVRYNDGTTANVNYSLKKTIKWSKDITWVYFYFGMPYTSTEEIVITNLQVRRASEVLPFVPYVDTSDVTITATGRNVMLWNDFEFIGQNMDSYCRDGVVGRMAKTGVTTSWVAGESFGMIEDNFPNPYLEPGTYIFTGEWVSIPTAYAAKKIYLGLEYEDGATASWYSGEALTVTKRVKIISVRCESVSLKNGEHMAVKLQIEYGNVANPYEKAFRYDFTQSGVISGKINYLFIQSSIEDTSASICINYLKPYNQTFTHDGDLQSITVDRASTPKYFGFGVCQKATIKLLDKERKHNISSTGIFNVYFDNNGVLPWFYIDDVKRDENTNGLTITAYDAIYLAEKHKVKELSLDGYTIATFVGACGKLLGVDVVYPGAVNEFNLQYDSGANFDGAETIREALNAVAEATQTIYFMNNENKLVFVRLDKFGDAVYTIDKSQYFTLNNKKGLELTRVVSATELGDNYEKDGTEDAQYKIDGNTKYYEAGIEDGETQVVRDNPFWVLRDDITTLVDNAYTAMKNMVIIPFDCSWRGNYFLEPGDKIAIVTKDNQTISSYLLNDTITYNGAFSQKTNLDYGKEEAVVANPTNLGETLKQTYAKVDKVNKQIDIVAGKVEANKSSIAAIQANTENIKTSVSTLEKVVDESTKSVTELQKKVETTITDEQVDIKIQTAVSGINKITTETDYTFDENGLQIAKSGSGFSTMITENGMYITKESTDVLVANNEGVVATDLTAKTFLIIGRNSRFQDSGNRTACYWIRG